MTLSKPDSATISKSKSCVLQRWSYLTKIRLTDSKYKALKMKILKINEYRLKDVKN